MTIGRWLLVVAALVSGSGRGSAVSAGALRHAHLRITAENADPMPDPKAVVLSASGQIRFTLLTPALLRIEQRLAPKRTIQACALSTATSRLLFACAGKGTRRL